MLDDDFDVVSSQFHFFGFFKLNFISCCSSSSVSSFSVASLSVIVIQLYNFLSILIIVRALESLLFINRKVCGMPFHSLAFTFACSAEKWEEKWDLRFFRTDYSAMICWGLFWNALHWECLNLLLSEDHDQLQRTNEILFGERKAVPPTDRNGLFIFHFLCPSAKIHL